MPMYNEASDLPDVLASLAAQTYPRSALRLIAIDGGSSDASRRVVEDWLFVEGVAGEVLLNPRRTIPTSLNMGIGAVPEHDIVIRLDAHTIYEPEYVEKIVEAFRIFPATVGCVGGSTIPEPETDFARALIVALYSNPLGLGGAEFRAISAPRPARSVYLGAWRPGVLQAAGGYDERWEANEDGELAARLRGLGWQLMLVPLRAGYRVKRTPQQIVRLWGKYGFWRAQTLRRHPGEWRIRHLVPPIALILGLALLATPWRIADVALFALYAAAIFAKRTPGERFVVTAASCVFFPITQIAWTTGLLRGLLDPRGVGSSTTVPATRNVMPLDPSLS
jgi:glycosyltransferase involved in cell wall biosynthesis